MGATGTPGAKGATGAARTPGKHRARTPRPAASPRSPVEVLDDLVARRRHPTSDPGDTADPGLAWEHHRPTDEEQRRLGRIRGFQRQGGSLAPSSGHRGRAVSWAAVALACVGFALGGLGVALGMSVVLLAVAGLVLAVAAVVAVRWDLLSDVVLDSPRVESEEPHDTPLHRIRRRDAVTS